jgi:flagellar biogenesis protein FliO
MRNNLQQLLAVIFVLAALWATAWFLKKKGGIPFALGVSASRGPRRIEQLDKARLTPQHSIHVMRIDGETIVVGVHPQGFTTIRAAKVEDHISPAGTS